MSTLDAISGRIALPQSAAGAKLAKAFSFPVLLGALLVTGASLRALHNLHDPDTWWHVAVGERILQERVLPESDPYSFTVGGNHWMAYEWLGEILLAVAARQQGVIGLKALLVLLAGTLFLLLYYYCYLRSKSIKASFVACTVLLPLATITFTARPQLLGYCFLVLTLICLERFQQGSSKALWILPLIFLVWVNTHGSFAFGLFVMGIYFAAGLFRFEWGAISAEAWSPQQRLRLETAMLLSVVAITLTPYGTRLAAYPLEMALLQGNSTANIYEWLPAAPETWFGKFFVIVLLAYFVAQAALRQRYRLPELALFSFAVFSAALHRRFLIVFLIVFAPLLAALLARLLSPYNAAKDHPLLNAALVLAAVLAVAHFAPSRDELKTAVSRNYPEHAVEHLRSHPPAGPLFNEYGWGGYLIWALHPEQRVFIDGRADIYDYSGVFSDYLSISRVEEDALPLLRKYGIQACLVRQDGPISTLLSASPEWEQAYADEVSAIYVRKAGHASPAVLSAYRRAN